ncbi:MAG: histidinol-phosphatase [Clostridia bacterium]|nr:histidinol-phosphatase [Clostridia bacterium]
MNTRLILPKSNVHSHTTFSDGRDSAEDMVRAALALGFHTLGFSEHGCADYDDSAMPACRETEYRTEVLRLRSEYAGRIELLLGCEHDWLAPPSPYGYDYTIESVHYVRKDGALWSVDWTREKLVAAAREFYGGDFYRLCRDYFRTVCESIEGTNADILGHIELVMKFNEARDLFDDADPRYLGPALECAELAARSGRLVEINTGAIAKGYRTQPYPGPAMLKRVRECGGRVILSSDCHNSDYLDCGFAGAVELARACGFKTAWEYQGATPVEYPL